MQATKEEAMIALNTAKQELDFTKSGEDSESLVAAIQEAAAAYKALYIKAHGAGIKLPRSATIVSDDKAVWQKDDLIGAQDWMLFENEGWALVEELPDLPEGFNRTYYMAHETGEHPEEIIPVSAHPLPCFCSFRFPCEAPQPVAHVRLHDLNVNKSPEECESPLVGRFMQYLCCVIRGHQAGRHTDGVFGCPFLV
jgi:hypothetical protein